MTEIRLATASNVRSFQILAHALVSCDSKWKEQVALEALDDEFGRFRVWSGNLGALQKGHSSLDYRLRDSPLLSGNTLRFLEELNHNLEEAIAIISGSRLPFEEQPKPSSAKDGADGEDEDDDDFFSDDDEEGEACGQKKELTMRYEEIVDIIDNLYKLSVRIRTPTIRSRSLKAASYQPKDPDTGVDILGSYAQYDKQHVRELLRDLRKSQGKDEEINDEYLVPRLAQSITMRRRQFKYWKRHRDKLSSSTVLDAEKDVDEKQTVEVPNIPLHDGKSAVKQPTLDTSLPVLLKDATSQKTSKTMLSGTEATHHHQSLDDIIDTKSVTSYAATVTDINGKGVNLPPPPKGADGERDFECPYCYIICPARYGRGRPWRTHLLQDLQPYVCTYPDCESSEQLFRSRREWNEHEAGHRKAWRCPEHPLAVYSSRAGLEDHLRQQHLDSFPESQLDAIVKVGETSTVETREKCPVCSLRTDAEGMGDFANHVANHLERLAVFALPNCGEEDADGASSVASRGRSGSTASQDASDMSLPSDTSDELELSEIPAHQPQRSVEEPLLHDSDLGDMHTGQSLLSAESLLLIPDVSQDRFDVVLAHRVEENDTDDDEVDNDEDSKTATADIEAHLDHLEKFRAYLLSLSGAQTVRFFKRYGAWRGHAIFEKGVYAAQALESFDRALYPDVNLKLGTETNSNKLRFSVQSKQEAPPPPSRQSMLGTKNLDERSVSSPPMQYDDEGTDQSKQPILDVSEIPTLHEMYRSRKLLQRDQSFAPNDSHNRVISFCYYDLTRLKVDAIVNSAGQSLRPSKHSPSLDFHVHRAGGPKFTEEAVSKGTLHSGQAVLTGGHNLPCEFVIHASRPHYGKNKGMGQFNVLTECYRSALEIALLSNFKTIAFPCLCAGGSGFPPRVAARVALQEVREFLDSHAQHPFEKIIFVVKSVSDEKAYMDFFPAFFPPTHGDLEAARSSELSAGRASLAAQVLEARLEVERAAENLSAELRLYVPEFPEQVLEELSGINEAFGSIRGFLLGSKPLKHDLVDLSLLCSVMQAVCNSVRELTGSAKNMPYSGGQSHKNLWNEFNDRRKTAYGSDLEELLRDCQDYAHYVDDILTRDGNEVEDIKPIRARLDQFQTKQKDKARDRLDEALYAREFQRESNAPNRDAVRLHQIPSVAQLYASHKLEEKATMVRPSNAFNQTVCLIREDITKLEVTIMVNSTDMTFAGMGTLDRKVFNKGGFELREECTKLGVCKEGDVKLTGGYNLPSKHVLHVVPPEQWTKNTKDVLRRIYREVLHTAHSLHATSIAIPAIGTGMLGYPRRDCAALAMEEVNRFLETTESSTMLEKIVLVVYSSNDEFVYKSVLPVYFPPTDREVNKTLYASHPISKKEPEPSETIPAPKRTLFSSISDAVRNLGSSSSRKRPVAHTWRAINTYEEHALISFESHAKDCDTCKNVEQLYQKEKDLCEHGYPLAQALLWYMNMGSDQLVYTRPVQIRQSIRLEVPEDMFPLSLTLLRLVEASSRDERRQHPWISPNRAYTTVVRGRPEQDDGATGPTIYTAETARASVEVWSISERTWSPASPSDCIIFIRPGKIDVYEAHAPSTAQKPLLTFTLDANAVLTRHDDRHGLVIRGAVSTQINNNARIMLVSQDETESASLRAKLKRANPDLHIGQIGQIDQPPAMTAKEADKYEGQASQVDSPEIRGDVTSVSSPSQGSEQARLLPAESSHLKGRLSPLQEKMQRLSEAASRFNKQRPSQQSTAIAELGGDSSSSSQLHRLYEESRPKSSQDTLTALEDQILRHLSEDLKSRPGSYIGQTTKDIASALRRPSEEVTAASESLARQGYIHNTINKSTWVVSHTPQELPALGGSTPQSSTPAGPSVETAIVRDATEFRDTPPSPVLATTSSEGLSPSVNTVPAANIETLGDDDSSLYPYDPATRWTRIDASYVDPQVLTDLGEEFHADGYSVVVHRVLRRGELDEWVKKTIDFRLKKNEIARVRRGVSGHTWLDKGKQRSDGKDDRDQRQENLDRLIAGDVREDELRHFKADDEAENKR